jgi:hypothetical protein
MLILDDIDALADLPWPEDSRLDKLGLGQKEPRLKFFYHLVKLRKPEVALELGCLSGYVSAYMAAAGNQPTVAIDKGAGQSVLYDIPALFDNFHFIQGDTRDVAEQVAEYGKVGVVWHDSSHLYGETCEEWEAYRPFLDRDAVWVCDDVRIAMGNDPGVWRFWNEAPGREKKLYWENSPFRRGATIGVILV